MRGFFRMLKGDPPPRMQNMKDLINPNNAIQTSQRISASGMPAQEKMAALENMRYAIQGNENLTLDQQDRALSENIIASEQVAAEAGHISWDDFYQYERDARQDVEQRIATRHMLRSGL